VAQQLERVAVDAFVEYAQASGNHRARLRASWHAMRDLVGVERAVLGAEQLGRQESGARALARDLGKSVRVAFEVEPVEVTTDVLAAADVAVLHLVRNAIDHGLEPASERAGKAEVGALRIASAQRGDKLVLLIEDDGRGIDFERVRVRATELGLAVPREVGDPGWLEVLCHPALSTRREATEVSGRGVGLAAARAAIGDVGGALSFSTTRGGGTAWRIAIPIEPITIAAHVLRVPNLRFPIAISADWRVDTEARSGMVVDVATHLGLAPSSPHAQIVWFTRGGAAIGVPIEDAPREQAIRRIVCAAVDVFTADGMEGLLVDPIQLLS
jgi:two-component sensor histidine kinase